jgi:hypothetical protein
MAFFFGPNLDKELSALPTCHGPDDPPKYPPISYGAYKVGFVAANYSNITPVK